jgi:hypothetical protein
VVAVATLSFLGVRLNLVPEAIRQVGNFTRLRCDCSWLRRGYVEEVYARLQS